jgi:hypothetical protein
MSVLKEFNELHISLRSFLLGLTLTIPFWFMIIFIFKPILITEHEVHIPIIISFCLSVCYFTPTVFIASFSSDVLYKKDIGLSKMFLFAMLIAVFWLSLMIYIGYYMSWDFMHFLNVIYGATIVRFVVWLYVHSYFADKRKANGEKNPEVDIQK